MNTENAKEHLWTLFNRKWTKDVGTKDYNKEEWQELEKLILYFMVTKENTSKKSKQSKQ